MHWFPLQNLRMAELCRSETLSTARQQHDRDLAVRKEQHDAALLGLQQQLDAGAQALTEQVSAPLGGGLFTLWDAHRQGSPAFDV